MAIKTYWPSKRCVFSLGVGKPVLKLTLKRLGESLKPVGFDDVISTWMNHCQADTPVSFKRRSNLKAKAVSQQKNLSESKCFGLMPLRSNSESSISTSLN
jgi:hypothetical protein